MPNSFKIFALVLLLLMPFWTLQAQKGIVRELTLDRCISLAQRQSPEANIARKAYEAVYWSYRSYKAGLLPQVRLQADIPGLSRSFLQNTLDDGTISFVKQNLASSSATLSINQQIAPTGGNVYLNSRLNRTDLFGTNPNTQYRTSPIVLGLRQPLFAFNRFKWDKEIQPLRFKLAEKSYLEALEDIAIGITGKYFDVYIAQIRLINIRFNEAVNDSIFFIARGRFNVGKIAENDLLQTELAALNAQADARRAELNLEKARTDLAISLGFNDPENIVVLPPLDMPIVEVDQNFALAEARANRSDMINYRVRGLEAESALSRSRSENRFNASLVAEVGLNQVGNTFLEAYQNPQSQQTVSLGIDIPLLQWGKGKAAVKSALVEQQRVFAQLKLDQRRFERDIRFQVLDFLQLQAQVSLSAKADTIAQRRYDVAKNRYLIGKIDITNMQIAQTEKDNSRSAYIQTLKQFWVAYYRLRRSTHYDFLGGHPLEIPQITVD
ncbi:MAG TPA: TolC family protein [Bacteroidetes bacterium]|nr:TolC family protein [Bacteroidota bacterium]